jgi:hypothetical protein
MEFKFQANLRSCSNNGPIHMMNTYLRTPLENMLVVRVSANSEVVLLLAVLFLTR